MARVLAEVDGAKQGDLAAQHATQRRPVARCIALRSLPGHLLAQPLAIVGGEPLRHLRPVGEVPQGDQAQDDGGQAFDEEEPLPAVQAEASVELQERFRDGCPGHHGHGRRGHEERPGPGPLARGDPVGEIQDHSREEAGFGETQQDTQRVEARGALHQGHGHGHDPPTDHDARHPDARSHPLEDEVARDFEKKVAEEEEAGAEAVGRVADPEIPLHVAGGERDVDPVQVGDHVAQEHEGHEAPDHLSEHPALTVFSHHRSFSGDHGRGGYHGTSSGRRLSRGRSARRDSRSRPGSARRGRGSGRASTRPLRS